MESGHSDTPSVSGQSPPTISIIPTLDLQCNALARVFVLFKG